MSSANPDSPGGIAATMLPLAYPRLWFLAGMLLVVAIMIGSLMPDEYVEKVTVWNDKVTHALAYTGLMLWFAGIYPGPRYPRIALALVAFSALIEVLQSAMPLGRHGDFIDLIANSAGVGAGLLLARFFCGGWAQTAESRLRQMLSES